VKKTDDDDAESDSLEVEFESEVFNVVDSFDSNLGPFVTVRGGEGGWSSMGGSSGGALVEVTRGGEGMINGTGGAISLSSLPD